MNYPGLFRKLAMFLWLYTGVALGAEGAECSVDRMNAPLWRAELILDDLYIEACDRKWDAFAIILLSRGYQVLEPYRYECVMVKAAALLADSERVEYKVAKCEPASLSMIVEVDRQTGAVKGFCRGRIEN